MPMVTQWEQTTKNEDYEGATWPRGNTVTRPRETSVGSRKASAWRVARGPRPTSESRAGPEGRTRLLPGNIAGSPSRPRSPSEWQSELQAAVPSPTLNAPVRTHRRKGLRWGTRAPNCPRPRLLSPGSLTCADLGQQKAGQTREAAAHRVRTRPARGRRSPPARSRDKVRVVNDSHAPRRGAEGTLAG